MFALVRIKMYLSSFMKIYLKTVETHVKTSNSFVDNNISLNWMVLDIFDKNKPSRHFLVQSQQ